MINWLTSSQALGLHFFNPVPVMKLVELIPALQTSQDVVDRATAFAAACGKTITRSADTPGFVSNRLLVPFINEGACVAGVMMVLSRVMLRSSPNFCLFQPSSPSRRAWRQRRTSTRRSSWA